MYTDFFQLRCAPFSIAPDPHYLFMSERHREALAHLLFGVDAGGGIVLLTGEIGAGKTTVCRCFLEQVPAHCQVGYIFNPKLTVQELLLTICEEFRIPTGDAPDSAKRLVDALNRHLLESHAAGRNNVLIIDEAQNLSPGVLEQLRLLTNLETNERKLLQIILIGQPELRDMLAAPDLEQLAQRVIARYHLDALSVAETAGYVAHRLAVAGLHGPSPFPPRLSDSIHRLSRGIPRRINLLCDRALLGAYALGARQVSRDILLQAADEVFGAGAAPRRRQRRALAAVLGLVFCGVLAAAAAQLGLVSLPHRGAASEPAGATRHEQVASAPEVPAEPVARASEAPAPPTPPAPLAEAALPPAPLAQASPSAALAALGVPAVPVASATKNSTAGAPLLKSSDLAAALAAAPAAETQLLPELAALWQVKLGPDASCGAAQAAGLHCYYGAGGLAELRQLGRPAILTLAHDGSGQRHALLLALDASGALLQFGGQQRRVSLLALEERLPGRYLTLWRAPAEFRALLKPGYSGPDVDIIAARLAALNGEAAPPAGRAYDAALAKAVRAFQAAQGLAGDGVIGPKTVMYLNSASQVAEPRLGRLAQLQTAGKE
jgi:general secretion pathway protein A